MRWSIVRLIWARELRDQLRDRRTLFMIVVLPVLLYPIGGAGMLQMALGFLKQEGVVAVVGARNLAAGGRWWQPPSRRVPPLFTEGPRRCVAADYLARPEDADQFDLRFPEGADEARADLAARQADLVVIVPPDFAAEACGDGRPALELRSRDDDPSRLVRARFEAVLAKYRERLKEERLARHGLPPHFDEPFEWRDADPERPPARRTADDISRLLAQVFPFVLVLWSLAGALYPAVDVCAGEKERGTMETLLISPASREEIVWGKFLTVWTFSAAAALLNLFSMGLTTWYFSSRLPQDPFRPSILLWGVVLLLPLSAFFSAVCLAVGVYARSTKEGQYYLMPLFLLTMPLIFLTLAPGVELNQFYSMVPVTGVALLMQELMKSGAPRAGLWAYFAATLAPMLVYSWLALRWAVEQFSREEVLFREAERFVLLLWLRRLFRDKEALPSAGQAVFSFGLVFGLTCLFLRPGGEPPTLARVTVAYLAFVAAPPLFMALLLTRRPLAGLGLRASGWGGWLAGALLALLLFVPMAELTGWVLRQFPWLRDQLRAQQAARGGGPPPDWRKLAAELAALALVQAVGEEVAFRGFILSGLARRYRPWKAVLLSSFLFALFQMNVFQALPHFVLGVVLGVLTLRSGGVGPAVLLHFVYNVLVYGVLLLGPWVAPEALAALTADGGLSGAAVAVGVASALLAAAVLFAVGRGGAAAAKGEG